MNLQHRDERAARGDSPPQFLHRHFTYADCSLRYCFRIGSEITNPVFKRFGGARYSDSGFCNVLEDIPRLLWVSPTYAEKRLDPISILWSAGYPHSSTEYLLFFAGSA